MEINTLKKHFSFNRITCYLSQVTKISLKISSVLLTLSILLILLYRIPIWEMDIVSGVIIWYTIFIAIYSIFFSAIMILGMAILYRRKQLDLWKLIKKETLLLALTIGLIMVLALTIYIVNYIN